MNPVKGTVLSKFAEAGEIAAPGRALYKIADLSVMELKVYVSGTQLPGVKQDQQVEVLIDADKKTNRKLSGIVSWISPKAEFTPKIIQTKEERVNLVYGVKIRVANDGSLKIAMPAEVNFTAKKLEFKIEHICLIHSIINQVQTKFKPILKTMKITITAALTCNFNGICHSSQRTGKTG